MKRAPQVAEPVSSKTISEFLLDNALTKAAVVLEGRRLFLLNDEHWDCFMAAFEAPPQPSRALKNC